MPYYLSQEEGGGHRKALQAELSWVSTLVANWSLSLVDNRLMQLAACESTPWPIVQGSIRHDCHQCSLEAYHGDGIHVLECVFQYYDCIMRLLPCGPAATLFRLASCFVYCEDYLLHSRRVIRSRTYVLAVLYYCTLSWRYDDLPHSGTLHEQSEMRAQTRFVKPCGFLIE